MSEDRNYRNTSSSEGPESRDQKTRAGASARANDQSNIPSISLPKGGGAIRGIGEKFGVNPASGTSFLTLPLVASPGRTGFTPELSLSYNSGSGNGPFGFGWGLSLPAITRKTDKGLPRYLDGDESDVFLISGAEDLVPILDATQNPISFQRTVHNLAYKVHLYRPRTEGLFSRIERWTRLDTQTSHWRTINRDNVTTLFGADENSRIVDPKDPRRIFSYLISFTFDDKGNTTQYEYAVDDLAGIDRASAHESNRSDADRSAQKYLKRVRYGNVQPYFPDWSAASPETPRPTEWHFQIVFDYGDHRAEAPTPVRDPAVDPTWPVRPDPFSTYRSGFEVRTYRRCERVLMFHNFPDEASAGADTLVRSTDFRYSDEVTPSDPLNPIFTFLESVTQTGYRRQGNGYQHRSMPPLDFSYSQPEIHSEILTLADAGSRENLPEGFDETRFRWIDLDGEGLSGILMEQNGAWSYKRNLSPINQVALPEGGRATRALFGPLERIPSLPVPADLSKQQLIDLTGEGRLDLVTYDAPLPGYFERTDNDWDSLKTFSSLPRLNWSEPNLKFVDLTGDGQADVLITADDVYTFYPSLGVAGFAAAEQVFTPLEERLGPRVVFADGTQTISLADMSGDGLSDIVRIRNGEVCYWPNLGYGRFGARVTMDNAPRFTDDERFDARRIRLADVDGSGVTDILYVGEAGVSACFNRSGNSWAAPNVLAVFPSADDLSSVQVMDLLGNGTACLVWSSPLPGEAYVSLRYVDLMGSQKPHLMVRSRNNLGAETRVSYASSTRFYLEDKGAGKPWITRLPFPVHVVERVETYDWISRSRFVTRYTYHHGYFDGKEREFCGFGMVEQRDTETHRDDVLFPDVETTNEGAASLVPPVLTRTWFHTGAFNESETFSQQYPHEYWTEPDLRGDEPNVVAAREAMLLPDTVIENGFDPDEMREAFRALKGSALRIEVYAEDGTAEAEHPYTVTEQNLTVTRLQPRGPNQHAVFFTHPRESLHYNYERKPNDPRVTHDLTLEVDEFGNVRRSVAAAYRRRAGLPEPEPNLSAAFRAMLAHDQTRLHITATEKIFTDPVNRPADAAPFDAYRASLPCETITAELTGITPVGSRFSFEETDVHWTTLWTGANDIPYENVSTPDIDGTGAPAPLGRRIVERTRTLYRSNDLTTLLPLRSLNSNALPGESYHLALTPGLINRVFGNRVTDPILLEGGYVHFAGDQNWWIPGGRVFYSPGDTDSAPQELSVARANFYQVRRSVDAFGAISRIGYDNYNLLANSSTDPLGNVIQADNDYRVLRPFRVTDPNGNPGEAAFDCLGNVVGTAVRSKTGEGDTLNGFDPELSEAAIEAVHADPLNNPGAILGNASTRMVYDLFAYFRTQASPQPDAVMVYTLSRETHVSDLPDGQTTSFDHLMVYSDGFAREAQRKIQAEPGPIPNVGDNVSPRWVGSGWTIYNNKGKPVRQFEPFFTDTHQFEFNKQSGVSSVTFYDPLDRVVAILHPDNTFEKTVFDAWQKETWDANDTVLISNPLTDPDAGDFFERLLAGGPAFTSWHARRIGGTFGNSAADQAANQDAATKSAAHAATPLVTHFDSLGRICLSVSDNGTVNGVPQRFATRTVLDAEDKPLAVFDALGRRAMESCLRETTAGLQYVAGYDIAGNPLYHNSSDSGERRMLNNVAGKNMRIWNARGFVFRTRYDALKRPTHRFMERPGFAEVLLERSVYGEKHPDADRNLKSRLYRQYDGTGVTSNDRYDFKGNLQETTQQFARIGSATQPSSFYNTTPDWSPIINIVDVPALDIAGLDNLTAPLLVASDRFTSFNRFDALNRPVQMVTPHAAGGRPSVVQMTYNEANLLERVDVWIRQLTSPAAVLDPATADIHAVTDIDYNARGQRTRVELGNSTVTTYGYDPETFRLTNLTTTRPNNFAANARTVQDLTYQYDPVGNITRLRDTADIQNVVYFNNQRVEPSADYTYDPLYRLTSATGREHLGQTGNALNVPVQINHDDSLRTHSAPNTRHLNPGDGNAMGNYTEQYAYDPVGNILQMIHQVVSGSWTRRYAYEQPSQITAVEMCNRLSTSSLPGDNPLGPFSAQYQYDQHGNMIAMAHLPRLTWNADDHLQSTTRQVVNEGMPETTYYSYNAEGERLRKVTFSQTNTRKSERLYLGIFEIYREYDGAGDVQLERETVHVMDDQNRVAMVETRTIGQDPAPPQLIRYQFGNHLGSAILELDTQADVISYEEYFPYGSTSYQAARNQTDTPKRYCYTRKERDEENDLYYHGARYYVPWLGRWTSCDPEGLVDGPNLYFYATNNPIRLLDPTGRNTTEDAFKLGVKATKSIKKADLAITKENERWKQLKEQRKKEGGEITPEELKEHKDTLRTLTQAKASLIRSRRAALEIAAEGLRGSLRFDHKDAARHIANVMEAALDAGVTDRAQIAYMIATADHESFMGRKMTEPASEAKKRGYSEKYRGRGYGHLTREANYERFGKIFGVDLVADPDKAADEKLSAKILVNQLTETPSRPVKRGGKKVWWTLKDFGVVEGGKQKDVAIGWVEARGMHNVMTKDERKDAEAIRDVSKKIYKELGGTFAPP